MLLLVLTTYLFVQGPRLQLWAWHFSCPPRLFPVFDRLALMDQLRLLGFPKKVLKKVFTHNLNTLSVYPAIQSKYSEVLGRLVRDFFFIFILAFFLFGPTDRPTDPKSGNAFDSKQKS